MSDERTPSSSPGNPSELQQLEAALAAGHLTPELFATLKAQLRPDPPAAPIAPTAPTKSTFSPSGTDEELPSLLDMFNQAPAAPASPPAPPAARPASPPPPSAADAAARQLIEERLKQIRQRPAAAPAPPVAPPSFYPEPPAYTPPAPPAPAPSFYPEPTAASSQPAPDLYAPSQPVAAASPPPQRPAAPRPAEPVANGRSWWPLVVVLVLAVVGALAYFFIQNSHPDESLTSPSLPAADVAPKKVAAPKPAKRTKKSAKKKRKQKAAAPVAVTNEEAAAPEEEPIVASAPAAAAPAASEAPAAGNRRSPPAAPEAGDDAATVKVREAMAAYYADLLAPPLHASQHFAPQVERLYIQQNLTPAAIDAELARSFFPENQQAIARIEPGSLRVSAPAADGSRTATFIETMRLYRVSLGKNQQLRTQVRVRFNADYKIVYMRQEKLLANTFE